MTRSNPARRRRWFDRGATAFDQSFPELRSRLPHTSYVCPLCDCAFPRDAVDTGALTEEHVPPAKFKGRPLVLTCQPCNNTAGTELDAHARRKENVAEILKGTFSGTVGVSFEQGGIRVNSLLAVSDSTWNLTGFERRNTPAVVDALRKQPLAAGRAVTVDLAGERFAELGARLSWLRSGFLALFAVYGYRFSFDPAIRLVKEQLRSRERLIQCFTVDVSPEHSGLAWSDWRIFEIPDPRCTGVLFRRYLTLFPHPGDVAFYNRLAKQISEEPTRRFSFKGGGIFLPGGEPSFGLPLPDAGGA